MWSSYFLFLLLTHIIPTYTYYLSTNKLSFINSNIYCNTSCDSSLASIHSFIQHNSIINTLLSLSTVSVWIGLNDINTKGNFTWIDGSILNYTFWNSSITPKPNCSTNCVQIHYIDNTNTTYWQSISCNTQQHFICNQCNTNSPTFEPTIEPTLEPTISLSLFPTYDPTIEPTIVISTQMENESSNTHNIFFTDYLWLAIGAATILFLACCCGICICYQRKKQYNTAMKDKHTHKYRKHLQFSSKISNASPNLEVPNKLQVPENSIHLEMTEKYNKDTIIVEQSNNAIIHLTTPKIDDKNKTETSLADLVIGDDVMSPSNNNGIFEELYRKGSELTSYGSDNNDMDIDVKMEDIQGDIDIDIYNGGSILTRNTNTILAKNMSINSGNVTAMYEENETEIGFSVIDYAVHKDDEQHPSESSSFTAESND